MSYILKCDKCGKVIENDKDKTTLVVIANVPCNLNGGDIIEDRLKYDLCPECRLKFNGWLFG